jgi:hypothetical protein
MKKGDYKIVKETYPLNGYDSICWIQVNNTLMENHRYIELWSNFSTAGWKSLFIMEYWYVCWVWSFNQWLVDLEEARIPGENHWPAASHRKTLSHKVVSSTPHYERDLNSQLLCYTWHVLWQ